MSIESVMPSNHLILCHPLLLPSIFPSIRVFSNESALCIRGPKYWSFSFNISPSNEHAGLSSFRMDWLDLLAVQGTLKSLLQHHSSKSMSSLGLSLLYGSTLTSIHDYWEINSWKATHSSILAWRIPWTTVHGVAKSQMQLSNFHFTSLHQLVGFLVQIFAVSFWKNQGKL